MSNVQIPNLPAAIGLNGSELLEAVQAGTSVRITTAQITALGTGLSLPWAVSVGGTGNTSFTQYGLLYGDGTNPIAQTGVGAVGEFLLGTGSAPVWGTLASNVVTGLSFGTTGLTPATLTKGNITVAGTLVAANGGTGQSSYAIGDLLYADTTTTLAKLPDVATGSVLISGGVGAAPSYSASPTLSGVVTASAFVANKTISTTATTGAYSYGTLAYSDTNIFASYQTNVNSYAQILLANTSNGASASTDFIVGNDLTTATTYYGDFGMNSSGFSGTGSLGLPNAVYLYSRNGDLSIGTNTANAIHFVVNGSATDSFLIPATGNFFQADFSNATTTSRLLFQTYTTNGSTGIYAVPNGTSTAASWQATNAADPTNASKILIATNGSTDVQLVSGRNGTGTYLPLSIYTGGSQVAQVGTTGNWGIGGNATAFIGIANSLSITGATSSYAQRNNGNVQSDVTVLAAGYFSNIALANAAFTTTDLVHFLANPPTGGAGSTATNQYGFKANSTLGSSGAATVTNSFGFYGDLAAAANKWNLYMNGTAQNYLAGGLGIGTTSLGGTGLTTASVWGGTAAGSTLTLTSTTNASASGDQVLVKVGNSGGVTAATFASTAAFLQLGAGTTAIAPLKFTSGTNLTTATAGSVEYNGTTALVTPIGAERGVAVTPQYYVNNATRTGPTAATTFVNILPANPSLTASTRYAFEIYFAITKTSANACTGAIGFSVTGTAPAALSYEVVSTTGAAQTTVASASMMSNYITTGFGTAVPVTAASAASANTYHTVLVRGTVDTGAGAITAFAPQFQYSTGAPTASTFQVGAYMYIYPLSATGAATSVGTWA